MKAHPSIFRSEHGFTLLEALVTIVIVSIGLLGLLGLQTVSLINTQVSASRSEASIAADNIADRMRANAEGAHKNYYDGISHPSANGKPNKLCRGGTRCNSEEMATYDAWEWDRAIMQQLPNGHGKIDCEKTVDSKCQSYRVTVAWSERDIDKAKADNTASAIIDQSFETVITP